MQKILVCAHDAGGAEIVSAWVKANPQFHFLFLLQGPAITVFSRKLVEFVNHSLNELPQLITQVNVVLTGTSWNSSLENNVITYAKIRGVFVISYLDHWTNYLERFNYQNRYSLPNEIWVGDDEAEVIAKDIFKETPIRLVPNEYLLEMKEAYAKISVPTKHKINLLYICEPISAVSLWKTGQQNSQCYTEFSALEFFFCNVQKYQITDQIYIRLRLHPSEKKDKYHTFIKSQANHLSVSINADFTLLEDLAWADWVVGLSSMALVVASYLEKKVFTCVPKGAKVMTLPISTIQPFTYEAVQASLAMSKVNRDQYE